MNLFRRYCFYLLLLSSFIPLNVAYLYFDYYSGIELQIRRHYSSEDEESLLTLFKKNPRVIQFPVLSIQDHILFLMEISSFLAEEVVPTHPKNLVLRC